MGSFKQVALFVARVCLSSIFLIAAFAHMADFDGMESALTNSLYSISEHSGGAVWIQRAVEELIPWTLLLSVISVSLLVIGGVLVLLGIKYRFGAFLLLIFMFPTTLIMHHFYFLQGSDKQLQSVMFWKNIAIMGGLLLLATYPQTASYQEDM